jgi:hypothetical protein
MMPLRDTTLLHRAGLGCLLATMLVVLVAPAVIGAQSHDDAVSGVARWTTRLESLAPETPMAYFELAEEVADGAESDAEKQLARELFALAGTLDSVRLGRSACLALADLSEQSAQRTRLLILASMLNQRSGFDPISIELRSRVPDRDVAQEICEGLAYYRTGYGRRALQRLDDPEAVAILRQYARQLPGGINRILEDCEHYRGGNRPILMEMEINRLLQFEASLLAGDDLQWSEALLLNGDAPLPEVDPQRLQDAFAINAQRVYWRDGRWVMQP